MHVFQYTRYPNVATGKLELSLQMNVKTSADQFERLLGRKKYVSDCDENDVVTVIGQMFEDAIAGIRTELISEEGLKASVVVPFLQKLRDEDLFDYEF